MYFNTNRPATEGQLAQLFTGNPHLSPEQVGSNLFTSNSQAYDYVQQQGRNLGIGDPQEYYSRQQLAQQMANTPSGMQMEVARQMGQYGPNTLPGQMAAREGMANSLMARDEKQAAQIAALQKAQRLDQYQLPVTGQTPVLSPVMQEAARQRGISSAQFLLEQRLGGAATPSMSGGQMLPKPVAPLTGMAGPAPAGRLFNLPSFQRADPALTDNMFSALTGKDLSGYRKDWTAAKKEEREHGVNYLRRSAENGAAGFDEQGNLRFRRMVPNPTTGKLEATGDLWEGDPYQRAMAEHLSGLGSELAQFQELAKARAASTPTAAVATPFFGAPSPPEQDIPAYMQGTNETANFGENWVRGMGGTLGGMFSDLFHGRSREQNYDQIMAASANAPAGRAAVHARPLLESNPEFQAIARKDPERARRIIAAIQQSEHLQAPAMPQANAYPYMQ